MSSPIHLSPRPDPLDDSLVQRAKLGDQFALAELFGRYRPRLRNMVAFRMDRHLQGRIDPSDVLQDAFIVLADRLHEYVPEKKMTFFVWVRLVTMERLLRLHRDHIQTQKRDARRELSIEQQLGTDATSMSIAAGLLASATSACNRMARKEQRVALLSLLAKMDELDREIIALRIFEALTNGEAAEILGLTKQTASKRFIRAISRLRDEMVQIPGFAELF